MTFAQPYFLLLLLLLPLLAWLKGKVGFQPAFLYSSVQLVRGITGITRSRAGSILLKLRWLALALFVIALARPQLGEVNGPLSHDSGAAERKQRDHEVITRRPTDHVSVGRRVCLGCVAVTVSGGHAARTGI